jgi:hypothetical protein
MERLSHAELAQRAAQDVAVISGNLLVKRRQKSWFKSTSRLEAIKNLAILACSLQFVSFYQERYEQADQADQQDGADRLWTFLCGLELVCTVRRSV